MTAEGFRRSDHVFVCVGLLSSSVGFLPPSGAEQMSYHRTSPPCGSQQMPTQQCSGTNPYASPSPPLHCSQTEMWSVWDDGKYYSISTASTGLFFKVRVKRILRIVSKHNTNVINVLLRNITKTLNYVVLNCGVKPLNSFSPILCSGFLGRGYRAWLRP